MKFRLALAALSLLIAFGAFAATTNDLSDAEIQGLNLARQLLEQQPAGNFTNVGVLQIRCPNGTTTNFPVRFETVVGAINWQTIYTVSFVHYDNSNNFGWRGEIIAITHASGQPNRYKNTYAFSYGSKFRGEIMTEGPVGSQTRILSDKEIITPFANSDFWIADLGLDFFHWPEQKILKHDMKRGRSCEVLESTNPNSSANSYSRVVSWIDNETLGIIHVEAYDAKGKLLASGRGTYFNAPPKA